MSRSNVRKSRSYHMKQWRQEVHQDFRHKEKQILKRVKYLDLETQDIVLPIKMQEEGDLADSPMDLW